MVVFGVLPKPWNGNPKFSELMVSPENVRVSAEYRFWNVLPSPP
jgi:hypothetical protein